MDFGKDYYSILGIQKSATAAEIKKAFKSLAGKNHPDKGGSTEKFQEINEAYAVLGDTAKRAEYDQARENPFRRHRSSNPFYTDYERARVFEEAFGDWVTRAGHRTQTNAKPETSITISISLKDAFTGAKKIIDMAQYSVELTIPRGIRSGQKLRINHASASVLVIVNVRAEDGWTVDGSTLIHKVPVTCFDAILGTTISTNHLDGRPLNLKLPANSDESTRILIKEEGMYDNVKKESGDLIIQPKILIPKNLTTDQKDALRKLLSNEG